MEAFHELLLFVPVVDQVVAAPGAQTVAAGRQLSPAQQFSLRYSIRPFTVEKLAE
jgi:hypothetical protein